MKQLILAGLCLSLGACMMVGPDYEVPGDAAVQRNDLNGPLRQDADSVVSAPVPEDWWQLYQDQRLNELVRQALAIDPEHPSALMMSGVVAYQRSDFDGAVRDWEKLLALLEPGSEDAKMTQENLDDARAQSALTKAQKNRP